MGSCPQTTDPSAVLSQIFNRRRTGWPSPTPTPTLTLRRSPTPPGSQLTRSSVSRFALICLTKKQDFLSADDLGEIMRAMGFRPTEEELKSLLEEIDEDGSSEIEIGEFCQLCATFLVEDPDMETMKRELKDAFRLYD